MGSSLAIEHQIPQLLALRREDARVEVEEEGIRGRMTHECLYHPRSVKLEMLACAAHCSHVEIPHLRQLASIPPEARVSLVAINPRSVDQSMVLASGS